MPLRSRPRRATRRPRKAVRRPRKRNARLRRRFAKGSGSTLRTFTGGFPKSMMIKMKFRQFQTNVSSLGTPSLNSFRGNSIYDPSAGIGGSQPKYYQTLARVYNQYRVHACKIRITPFYNATVPTENPLLAIIPSGYDQPVYLTWDRIAEDSHAKWMPVVANQVGHPRVLTHWAKSKNILNCKDLKDLETSASNTDNNPQAVWYFNIYAGHPNNTTPVTMYCHVELTYYVEWFDLRETYGM